MMVDFRENLRRKNGANFQALMHLMPGYLIVHINVAIVDTLFR